MVPVMRSIDFMNILNDTTSPTACDSAPDDTTPTFSMINQPLQLPHLSAIKLNKIFICPANAPLINNDG